MANPEHIEILKQGVEVWNKWRGDNPNVIQTLAYQTTTKYTLSRQTLLGQTFTAPTLMERTLAGRI